MAEVYLERLERKDVASFGDKTPEQTSRLAAIRDVFPDAKIVFLCRDGRDVAYGFGNCEGIPDREYACHGGLGEDRIFGNNDPNTGSTLVKNCTH